MSGPPAAANRPSSAPGSCPRCGAPLADGSLPPADSPRWPIHVITPTSHPLEALAASLTRDSESVTATATLIDDLARDPRGLHLYIRKLLGRASANRLLVVIDQFEELFALCRDEAERRGFVDNLMTAVSPETDGPTTVILTLRADFYAHCASYPQLREAVARHQEYIGPMSTEELRRAIEEPAKRGGWELEPGLVDTLLKDVGDEPGALPLLSHALLETWMRRRGRTLTLRGYAEAGGVSGALAKTAGQVYAGFTPEQQAMAQSIFLRLTELGEGTQDTRRRASLEELIPKPEDRPAVEAVLKTLADARLVAIGENTAEVAHEALIREWPALREWLNENREGLRLHRHLTEAAQGWAKLSRDPGEVYRGARLAQAAEWAEAHADEMNALEREFVAASRELAEREEAEREAQRQRELEAAHKLAEAEKQRAEEQARAASRLRTRNRVITIVGAAAVVLALATGFFAVQSGQNAASADRNAATAQAVSTLALENAGTAQANADARATAEAEALAQHDEAQRQANLARAGELAAQAKVAIDRRQAVTALLLAVEA